MGSEHIRLLDYLLGNPPLNRLLTVTPAVYPHFVSHNISVPLPSAPIKILGKSGQGFLSYDRTNKQTDKQRLQLFIYRFKDTPSVAARRNFQLPLVLGVHVKFTTYNYILYCLIQADIDIKYS